MNSERAHQLTIQPDEAEFRFHPSDWSLAVLLVVATFFAYQPVWRGLPIWDDWRHMTPTGLAMLRGLRRIWLETQLTRRFDPLADTALWIENRWWGASTLGYHLVNIACHATTALLLVAVLRRLRIKGAWFAAAIFALHPVQVESVAWISEFKNTLSGVFFLGTTLAYVRFDDARARPSYALAMGLFVAALLSKPTTVVWPVGMIAILWWRRGALSWRRDVRPLVPFAAIGLLDGAVALAIERETVGNALGGLRFSLAQRLVIAGRAIWFYLGKLIWPVGLCPIYPRWAIEQLAGTDLLYPLGGLVLFVVLWMLRRRSRAPLAALLFFVGALLPLIGVFSFGYQGYAFVADHFQYLASLGIITLVAAGSAWFQDRWSLLPRAAAHGLCFAVLIVLAVLTWQHSHAFASFGAFARTILAEYPDNWAARDDLGVVLVAEGKPQEAIEEFHRALRGNPQYVLARYDLGSVLQAQGRLDEAAREYEEALRWRPHSVALRYNLGCLLAAQGKFDEAIEQYQDALRSEPDDPEVRNNLGTALVALGKLDEAVAQFRQAIELRSDFVEAHINLGHSLTIQKRTDEAIQQYEQAVQLDPTNSLARYDLAITLANSGDLSRAAVQLRQAAELNPNDTEIRRALMKVLGQQGIRDEALPAAPTPP